MKLTKEVIRLLKFHGYLTLTAPDEVFLNRFETVEELGIAGFITDREAFDTLGSVFDENGVNQIADMDEKNLTKQALNPDVIIIEETKIDSVDAVELNRPVEDVVETEETVAEEDGVEDAVEEESFITEGDVNEAPVEDFTENVVEDHSNDEIPVPADNLPEAEAEPDQGEGVEEGVVPKSTKSKPGKKKSSKKES